MTELPEKTLNTEYTPTLQVQLFCIGNNGSADAVFDDVLEEDLEFTSTLFILKYEGAVYYFPLANIKELRVIPEDW